MINVIAFTGKRRSGKTKASLELVTMGLDLGLNIRKVSFADPLREAFSKMKGVSVEMLTSDNFKEEFRPEMVAFGEAERAKSPRVFIDALFDTLLPDEIIVIDDCRFLSEMGAVVKEHKGLLYRIEASPQIREVRGWSYNPIIDESPSETELDLDPTTYRHLGGDIIYNNTNEVYKLKRELVYILDKITA